MAAACWVWCGGVDCKERINPEVTVLAAVYAIMHQDRVRFRQPRDYPDSMTWGFHHEDWHRAYQLLVFIKSRRGLSMPDQTKPKQVPQRLDSVSYGFFTDALRREMDEEGANQANAMSTAMMRRELGLVSQDMNAETLDKLGEAATSDEVKALVRRLHSVASLKGKARTDAIDKIMADPGNLPDVIAEHVSTVIHRLHPDTDLEESLTDRAGGPRKRIPITDAEKQALASLISTRVKIGTNGDQNRPWTQAPLEDTERLRAHANAEQAANQVAAA